MSILPQASISIGFGYLYFVSDNIQNLALFYSIGYLIAFLLNLYLIRNFFIVESFDRHPLLKELLENSFKIRLAHNINNFSRVDISTMQKKHLILYLPLLINVISTGLSEINKKSINDILKKINAYDFSSDINIDLYVFIAWN